MSWNGSKLYDFTITYGDNSEVLPVTPAENTDTVPKAVSTGAVVKRADNPDEVPTRDRTAERNEALKWRRGRHRVD